MEKKKRGAGAIERVCLLLIVLKVLGLLDGDSLLQVLIWGIILTVAAIGTIIIWFVWR